MINMVRADLFKMFKASTIKILFGITSLGAILMIVMAYFIPQGKLSEKMSGMAFLFSDVNMMSILGAVLAGIFICGDFDNKSIHQAIASGCSRGAVIMGKGLVFFFGVFILLLPYVIATGIALATGSKFSLGAISIGFLNVLSNESGKAMDSSMILKLILIMIILVLVYIAQLSICVPLAITLKKPVLVIAIFYGLSILSGQLSLLSKSSKPLRNFLYSTPFGGDYSLITLNSETETLVKAILVSIYFIVIMLNITYGIFKKAEIK
jgi:ABC-2 type transport system permease protein